MDVLNCSHEIVKTEFGGQNGLESSHPLRVCQSLEDFLFVIWTGNGLIFVEERGLSSETVSFRRSVREALELIGFKSLSKRPMPFPPSRIWSWGLQRHRWLLLGYALADNKSGGHWMDIPLGNKGELGVIWLSLNNINVGRFKKKAFGKPTG